MNNSNKRFYLLLKDNPELLTQATDLLSSGDSNSEIANSLVTIGITQKNGIAINKGSVPNVRTVVNKLNEGEVNE